MKRRIRKIVELCRLVGGVSTSRAKKGINESNRHEVKVLTPKAMKDGSIDHCLLATEMIGDVKEDCFTKTGDVVLKLSAPYDSVYIKDADAGLLVTTSGIILRKIAGAPINMGYISMILNSSLIRSVLAARSTGQTSVMTIRKSSIEDIEIPVIPMDKQQALFDLYLNVSERKDAMRKLIALDNELIESELKSIVWVG